MPPGVSYSELRRKFAVLKNVSKREFLSRPQLQIQVLGERLDASEQSTEQSTNTQFSNGVTPSVQGVQEQRAPSQQFAYGGTDNFYSEQKPNNEGLIEFAGGGTHEQNSNGGIPIGYDNNGNQNTVEDGETKYSFDDGEYIFSNRIDTNGGFKSAQQAATTKPMQNITQYAMGGGLTGKDRGTGDKAYPSVQSSDFAGGHRSYPIPTKADAVDALRLAGLHGRDDVRAKVFAKYPELKHADGGFLDTEMDDYDNTLYNTPLGDDFANSIPTESPMSKTLQRAYGGDLIIKRIFGGVNTYAEGGMMDGDPPNPEEIRQAQMARNAQTRDYVLKKAQLVKDQSAFAATLPERVGGGRIPTADELNKKQFYKDQISAYGDSIQMNRYNLTPDQLIKQYAAGKRAGLKRVDKEGSGSGINYSPNSMGEAMGAESGVEEKGIKEGTTCKQGVKFRKSGGMTGGKAYGGNLVLQSLNSKRR